MPPPDPHRPASLLIDVAPAVGGHGQRGIGRYVRGLATSIEAFPDDLRDRIWATGLAGPTLDSFGARAIPFEAGRRIGRMPAWVTGRTATAGALKRSGALVLHATDPQRPWIPAKVPSIVTVYDLIPLQEPEMLQSWRLDHRLAYRRYIRQVESAARILAISRATAEELHERLGIASERVDIVYPVVAPPTEILRSEPPEPMFLYVGALDPHKQPELALRGFAQFRSRFGHGRLRYVGPSDDRQERRLGALAAQLGVAESVSLEGRISDDDLESAYGAATALVSTSRVEGFGLPAVEAVLRRVPAIAIESRAARETLEGAATIVPADAEAIADAMAHPREPAEAAVDAMRARYSIASVARALAETYRRMLD
jgi:glycosyltransferase involved in cell wall biosynthesis